MRKKLVGMLLAVCMLLCLAPAAAHAQDVTTVKENVSIGRVTCTLRSDGTAVVTKVREDEKEILTIPAQVEDDGTTYTVTEVAARACKFYSGARGISLPDTLLVIGDEAFYNAAASTRGTTLVIPDSVVKIGEGAFAQNDFGKVVVGEGLTDIPSGAFKGVSTIGRDVELVLGEKVSTIAADAFDGGSVSQVTVKGDTGRLDSVIDQVGGLKKAEVSYDDPNALTSEWLQGQIDSAKDGSTQTIKITGPLNVTKTVTVPEQKDIILVDDGNSRTLTSKTDQMLEVKGRLTIESTSETSRLVFKGSTTEKTNMGNIARVSDGGVLVLKDAVFRGGAIKSSYSGAVVVDNGSRFEMSGGVIENFTLSGSVLTGTVCVKAGGDFQMSGGSILNNSNTKRRAGGGVILYAWNSSDPDATMTMSGSATIRGNRSRDGGGVYLIGNTDFHMNGGTIAENSASGNGGGVCVAGTGEAYGVSAAPAHDSKFSMDGGEISGNIAGKTGGGIYINTDDVVLRGGRIENNTAHSLGGGVYVSEPPQKVQVYNAVVTGNEASVMGGGLWFCPTGDATFSVTNGIAVYGNTAEGAGADFVSLGGDKGTVSLTDRLLGGGPVEWYADGAVKGSTGGGGITPPQNVTGSVDEAVARFDPANPGERLTNISGSGNLALKAVVSDGTKQLAESQAKLWITGNKAQRGGGIGANGAASLGEPRDYTLHVTKKWSEDTPESRKGALTVYLKIGDVELDSVELNEENGWTADFTQLPDPESLEGNLEYAVVESPVPDGFTPVYQDAVIDTDTNTIYVTVTNDYSPELTSVSVNKTWADDDDRDGIRPDSVTVRLYADGVDTGKALTLDEANGWRGSFDGLLKYDDDGRLIVYTVSEDAVEGYESSVSGSAEEGFVVTNTHTPPQETPPQENTPPDERLPQTGDHADAGLPLGLLALSGAALIAAGTLGKRGTPRR